MSLAYTKSTKTRDAYLSACRASARGNRLKTRGNDDDDDDDNIIITRAHGRRVAPGTDSGDVHDGGGRVFSGAGAALTPQPPSRPTIGPKKARDRWVEKRARTGRATLRRPDQYLRRRRASRAAAAAAADAAVVIAADRIIVIATSRAGPVVGSPPCGRRASESATVRR